jgi:hypothetical protein
MGEAIGFIRYPKYCASDLAIKDRVSLEVAKQFLQAIEQEIEEREKNPVIYDGPLDPITRIVRPADSRPGGAHIPRRDEDARTNNL